MDTQYTLRLDKIEAVLRRSLPETLSPQWIRDTFTPPAGRPSELPEMALPDPGLTSSLTTPAVDLLQRGGKRWRPLLMTLVCETLGGGDEALELTPLVEFPHNGSLIHDDIEDNSDERRGKPAIHVLYGVDTAINSGSFLYFLPLTCIDRWNAPEERKNRVYSLWARHLRRIHLGQGIDISWHRNFSTIPTTGEYETMCALKTGVLARMAAELGVYAAGNRVALDPAKEESTTAILGIAAEKLGVAFQILDDVKNLTTGNPGKKRGDDIVEGKKSLPILLFLQGQKDRNEFVKRCFSAARASGTGAKEVEELIGELDAAGVIEQAHKRGLQLIAEAKQSLETQAFRSLDTDSTAKELLLNLVSELM